MAGLFEICDQIVRKLRTRRLAVHLIGFVLLFASPLVADACRLSEGLDETPENGGAMIQITNSGMEGGYLVVTYNIQYPGMTKVKLFNGANELLWRNQYVDDKEGNHTVKFKASVLKSGNYVLVFDYKNQNQKVEFAM